MTTTQDGRGGDVRGAPQQQGAPVRARQPLALGWTWHLMQALDEMREQMTGGRPADLLVSRGAREYVARIDRAQDYLCTRAQRERAAECPAGWDHT